MTTLEKGSVRIETSTMAHARGAWAGPRPQWHTATHIPTGYTVRWHELADQSQWKQRETALACLALMIETMGAQPLPAPPNTQENDG